MDSSDNAYVMGSTQSADFPTASPFQPDRSGSDDAFVAMITGAESTTPNQPDLLIKLKDEPDSAYGIDNEYQTTPSGDQIEAQTVAKGGKATRTRESAYSVRIQNDGNTTRSLQPPDGR